MSDALLLDVVAVDELHHRLGLATALHYPQASMHKSMADWKMEIDDAPILRYLYRQTRPARHLEFGTWEGTGACYCLEECDAHVWTINLPDGEKVEGRPLYYSTPDQIPEGAAPTEVRGDVPIYQTDAGAFIGHRYRNAGFSNRVTQIYCDSREWDTSEFSAGFFDTVLIDGGHSEEVVLSDTDKALSVMRPGGLILWHDFCPDPSVFSTMPSVVGVVGALSRHWPDIARRLRQAFWIRPSFLLAGVRD
jgi:predicted O-methyltransferase YrrM